MKIFISATLRSFFNREHEIDVKGKTVGELLENIIKEYPDSKNAFYDETGERRGFIKLFVDGEDRTGRDYAVYSLSEKSKVLLLPVIAGGAPSLAQTEALVSDERRKEVELDNTEIERFNKHLLLREIGVKGQKRIKAAKVVVVGAGALGSAVIQYLAAAGVGTIKVIDSSAVALEDLQSQVLHSLRDVKRPKSASARDSIRNINRSIEVIAENEDISADNASELIEDFDLVVDCSDNFKTRYTLNDACILNGIPVVFGAIYQFEGQVSILGHNGGPCLRCVYPSPPPAGLVPNCAEGGTISPLAGIVGSIQANEALKLIMGIGEHLSGKLLTVDTLYLNSSVLNVKRSCNCPLCGDTPTSTEVETYDYEDFCGLKAKEDEVPVEGFTPEELAKKIDAGEPLKIIDVREPHERAILRFPGAVVIPIGQLVRRQKELDPNIDTVFLCKQGKRSILAINTLREAGYTGPMYNLKGGLDAMKDIVLANEGGWL